MQGGIYVFQIFDYYAASGMVLLCFCFTECIAVSWVYGVDRWMADITVIIRLNYPLISADWAYSQDMIGRRPSLWLKICWLVLTPTITLGLLVFSVVKYSPLKYDST